MRSLIRGEKNPYGYHSYYFKRGFNSTITLRVVVCLCLIVQDSTQFKVAKNATERVPCRLVPSSNGGGGRHTLRRDEHDTGVLLLTYLEISILCWTRLM